MHAGYARFESVRALHSSVHNLSTNLNALSTNVNSLSGRFTNFEKDASKKIVDLSDEIDMVTDDVIGELRGVHDRVAANYKALDAVITQNRDKTNQEMITIGGHFKERDRKIDSQAKKIKNLKLREENAETKIATLEAKIQEERAKRTLSDNRIQQLEGQVQGISLDQATVIETKVKVALIEQQNKILFKSLEEEGKEQEKFKHDVLNFAKTVQQFQRIFESDKKEAKAKFDENAFKIAKLRAQIAGVEEPKSEARVEDVPEHFQDDPIISEIVKELEEEKQQGLLPQGDLKLLKDQTIFIASLQEKYKISRERYNRYLNALNNKMNQLMHNQEMARQKQAENARQIAQLSEEIAEMKTKNSHEGIKKLKKQRSLMNVKT